MKHLLEAMEKSTLFAGLSEEQREGLAGQMQQQAYCRDQYLISQGEPAKGIGLVTEGSVHIVRFDFLGNREILAEAQTGDVFGEVYGILEDALHNVAVIAAADCRVVFFAMEQLMQDRTAHLILMRNLLKVVAGKNLMLTAKMAHLSKRTIRGKVISYLSEEAGRQGKRCIAIPFDRQQLADYLAVERSALSRELSRMQEDGLIQFHKNVFRLA